MVIGVFLYFEKAFDTDPHDIFLKELHAYGIRGNALNLLKGYFTDRKQYLIYDGLRSGTKPVQCGVPHGSVLGPLLFIITMNDIGNDSDCYTLSHMQMVPVYC